MAMFNRITTRYIIRFPIKKAIVWVYILLTLPQFQTPKWVFLAIAQPACVSFKIHSATSEDPWN